MEESKFLIIVLMACGIIGIFGASFYVIMPNENLSQDLAASIFAEVVEQQARWQARADVLK